MSYEVIARKWRPRTFSEVVGQDAVVRTLSNAIASKRIAQAYLFAGPRGTGKTTLARIFAKALNCEKGPTAEPCGICPACRAIADGSSLDVTEIDGASNNKVEDVHSRVIDLLHNVPSQGRYRIFYIDEVHMLSAAAFNALLKSLEEPPEYVKFLFATTEPDKVLGTVLSRCQRFDLRRISLGDLQGQLSKICRAEGVEAEDDALLAIARGANGGMRDAESALDQIIAFTGRKITEEDVLGVFGLVSRAKMEELAGAILAGDIPAVLSHIDELDRSGKDLRRLSSELIDHFRNLLVCLSMKGDTRLLDLTEAQRATLTRQAGATTVSAVLAVMEELVRLDGSLRMALSRRTLLETSLIRCARASRLVDVETILRKLAKLEKEGIPVASAPAPAAPAPAPAAPAAPAPAPAAPAPAAPAPAAPAPAPAASSAPVLDPVAPWGKPVDLERLAAEAKPETVEEPKGPDVESVLVRPEVQAALKAFGGRIVDIR